MQNLYSIITQLENPRVRLDDNSPYRVNEEVLGKLYTSFIGKITVLDSPGIILFKETDLNPQTLQNFQKRFQVATRQYFSEALSDLLLRTHTAEGLTTCKKYQIVPFQREFSPNSIEGKVRELLTISNEPLADSLAKRFSLIGERLKEGAKSYDTEARSKGMDNYRFATEYNRILEALKR